MGKCFNSHTDDEFLQKSFKSILTMPQGVFGYFRVLKISISTDRNINNLYYFLSHENHTYAIGYYEYLYLFMLRIASSTT
jgi:hypothetical protein